jgi:DNA-binding transcriptional LysR family regulator
MDQVTGLRVFADLARSGSIAGTARALGMSQSMATKHLNALETRLETRLVHRSTRALVFTAAGAHYLEATQAWLAELDAVNVNIREGANAPVGHIRITAPVALGITVVGPIIERFLTKYPRTSVEMLLTDDHIDLVREGFDLAIRVSRSLTDGSLIARKLGMAKLVYCAAPSYFARRGVPSSPAELVDHDCLGYLAIDKFRQFQWKDPNQCGSPKAPSGRFHSNSIVLMMLMAISGQGILYEPDFVVQPYLNVGALVPLPFETDRPASTIYAVMPSRRMVPARVRLLTDSIASEWRTPEVNLSSLVAVARPYA